MAGTGIRPWELACALAADARVTLAAPAPIDLAASGITLASYTLGDATSLAALSAAADAVFANGHLLAHHPELAALPVPLMLDLYDPTPLENLELFRSASPAERAARAEQDAALLRDQLLAGDAFVCATERQRDLYVGALLALGRVTPALADADPLLRGLIDVVSFGLPATPPTADGSALRGVLPGIDANAPLLLWTGGLWDWLDPLTLRPLALWPSRPLRPLALSPSRPLRPPALSPSRPLRPLALSPSRPLRPLTLWPSRPQPSSASPTTWASAARRSCWASSPSHWLQRATPSP
jgi:hypothetical protein